MFANIEIRKIEESSCIVTVNLYKSIFLTSKQQFFPLYQYRISIKEFFICVLIDN